MDREGGELPTDPPPRYPYYITDDNAMRVQRRDWTDVKQRNDATRLMREGSPVVLKNTGLAGRVGPSKFPADDRPGLLGTWGPGARAPSAAAGGGPGGRGPGAAGRQEPGSAGSKDGPSGGGFDRLAALGYGGDSRKWRCMTASSSGKNANKFAPPIQGNNAFGSHYHVRIPQTELVRYSMKEFVQCARAWGKDKAVYLQDDVAVENKVTAAKAEEEGDGSLGATGAPVRPVAGGGGVGRDVVEGLDWRWLEGLRRSQRFGPVRSVVLGAGTIGSLLPAHHPTRTLAGSPPSSSSSTTDNNDNDNDPDAAAAAAAVDATRAAATGSTSYESLQCQIVGRRRVLLVSPDQSYKGMYPYPVSHPYDGYSMVDLDDVDYSKFPKIAGVRGQTCVVEPGDVLFVPEGWWRHEQGLSHEHACVEVRMGTGHRPRTSAAAVLAVGRTVEDRVCRAEGPRDARHWVRVVAEAEEADWVDLGTTTGQRRVDMAQMIRDEVDYGLPPPPTPPTTTKAPESRERRGRAWGRVRGRWQTFLRELIDGRMEPTPWLNDNFRDPLFISEAAAAMAAIGAAGPPGDTKVIGDGTGVPDPSSALMSSSLHDHLRGSDAFALTLPGGGVLTAQSKTLPDERSEAERRYPEFFVEKLRMEGWDARHTPVSVLNPEHPEFVGGGGSVG